MTYVVFTPIIYGINDVTECTSIVLDRNRQIEVLIAKMTFFHITPLEDAKPLLPTFSKIVCHFVGVSSVCVRKMDPKNDGGGNTRNIMGKANVLFFLFSGNEQMKMSFICFKDRIIGNRNLCYEFVNGIV